MLTPIQYDRFNVLDGRNDRGRLSETEKQEFETMYNTLSPQQKGAVHRRWKQQAKDEEYAEMRSGTPEGGY